MYSEIAATCVHVIVIIICSQVSYRLDDSGRFPVYKPVFQAIYAIVVGLNCSLQNNIGL